jgi:hypothetical protein
MSRQKRRWPNAKFVSLLCWLVWDKSKEFLALSAPARMSHFCLESAYIPRQNGDTGINGQIKLSYSTANKGPCFSPGTAISRDIHELGNASWDRGAKRSSLTQNGTLKKCSHNLFIIKYLQSISYAPWRRRYLMQYQQLVPSRFFRRVGDIGNVSCENGTSPSPERIHLWKRGQEFRRGRYMEFAYGLQEARAH